MFRLPPSTRVGMFAFTIPQEDMRKGNTTFPLPKDHSVHQVHQNYAKMHCNSFTNAEACESAGWSLNSKVDGDIICRYGVETQTKQAADLITKIGKEAKRVPVFGEIVDIFAAPVGAAVESAGKIETCHYLELPGSMTIDEFYKMEKDRRLSTQSTIPAPVQSVAPAPVPAAPVQGKVAMKSNSPKGKTMQEESMKTLKKLSDPPKCPFLDSNIKAEQNAIDDYTKEATRTTDSNWKNVITQIRDDEKRHKGILVAIKKQQKCK